MGFLTKEVFKNEMQDLCEIYNYEASKRQMELYYEHIKEKFTDASFEKACDKIVLSERFFPTVSAFIENNETPLTSEEIFKKHGLSA